MIDKWIQEDVDRLIGLRRKLVLLDPKGHCRFLLKALDIRRFKILETNDKFKQKWEMTMEELFLRFDAENELENKEIIFYVTRPQDNLSFLFDYCFTHGCLDLTYPQEWIRNKIFKNTGLNVSMENPLLLSAAKISFGKDITWWKKIIQNLQDLIDVNEELLPFLNDPLKYFNEKEPDIKRLFEEKLFELLGQPYIEKPPMTLANEVVKRIFDGLVNNDLSEPFENLYYKWIDSTTFSSSLAENIRDYKLSPSANPWGAHPDHCLEELDLKALREITSNIRDKSYLKEKLHKLEKRIFSPRTIGFIPVWWKDVFTLINGNTDGLTKCRDINTFIDFYIEKFCKIDRAIRRLYSNFLNTVEIIRPLQEYYENLNHELLQIWFNFQNEYKTTQQGYLAELFTKSKSKIAVIVGDGIRYEIADYVHEELNKQFKIDKDTVMLADLPTETENNMSALYCGNNEILKVHSERENKLKELTKKDILFLDLEDLHHGINADFLLLTYKDIDSTGEKLQQGAIKLFDEFENILIDKIRLLFNIGYKEVHLVTDHGFVLTGLLDESDKVIPILAGKIEIKERYIRTVEKQRNSELLEFSKQYGVYNFLYVARTSRPFKTKGRYGYSHGGFTPQEIIIPNIKFTKKPDSTPSLGVYFSNKTEIENVTGNIFELKIQSEKEIKGLFASSRKVQILLFSGGKQIQASNISQIEVDNTLSYEFSFNKNTEIKAVLIDSETKEQLDEIIIKQSKARDLGGLI